MLAVLRGCAVCSRRVLKLGDHATISNFFELIYVCRRAWDRQGVCGGRGTGPEMSVSGMLHFLHLTATAPRQVIEKLAENADLHNGSRRL
jgi:hypothetical protein